jgi:hypothetical protein
MRTTPIFETTEQALRITDGVTTNGTSATSIYTHPFVLDAFDATFEFRITPTGGQADGFVFAVENGGPNALAGLGGNLGVAGIGGYGIEFDLYQNGGACDSPGTNQHIGIDNLTGTACAGVPTSLTAVASPINLADSAWHDVHVVWATGGIVSVTVDTNAVFTNFQIPNYVSGPGYYLGFGGGTGGQYSKQEVRNVKMKFPTPRCL